MAFLISDICKRDMESSSEPAKSFLIRDILNWPMPAAAETVKIVQSCVTSENGDVNSLAASSTMSFMSDCLDRHQFHAVSLYVPSPTHRHQHHQQALPASLSTAFQPAQSTFQLPTSTGNNCYCHFDIHCIIYRKTEEN